MTMSTLTPGLATSDADVKIRIRDLSKVFQTKSGPFVALDTINLDIPRGCFFMIVGPSGCGKTTLLRILAGLEEHTTGSMEISAPAANRPGNSMVFQGDSLFPWMTVWDNAAYGLVMRGRPKAEVKEVVGHYLARTGLSRFHDSYPHQLSGGMRQRVSLRAPSPMTLTFCSLMSPSQHLMSRTKFCCRKSCCAFGKRHARL